MTPEGVKTVAGAWRRWRRTRPFWGGLLVTLAGGEILSTAILSLGVTLRVGIGGLGSFAGAVIAVVLLISGLLLWFNPAQRVFYSIVAVVLALATFNMINYGGFFIGMLLGIIGGSLAFAWSPEPGPPEPGQPGPDRPFRRRRGQGGRAAGLRRLRLPGGPRRRRLLSVAAVALALSGSSMPGISGLPFRATTALPPAATRATAVRAADGCILIILLCPSPTPSATSTPSGGGSASPTPAPSPSPSPGASSSPAPKPGKKHRRHGKDKPASATPGLVVAAVPSVLTAGSAQIRNLTYQGVAHLPTATGGRLTMMKFTLDSVALTGVPTLTIHENGSTAVTTTSRLTFSGHMLLFATRMSGALQVAGLSVPVTLKPGSAESLLLQVAGKVSGLNITMTHVVTDHPLTVSGASEWDNFHIKAG